MRIYCAISEGVGFGVGRWFHHHLHHVASLHKTCPTTLTCKTIKGCGSMMVGTSNPSDDFKCRIKFGYCFIWPNLKLQVLLLIHVEKQKLQEVTGLTLGVPSKNHVWRGYSCLGSIILLTSN